MKLESDDDTCHQAKENLSLKIHSSVITSFTSCLDNFINDVFGMLNNKAIKQFYRMTGDRRMNGEKVTVFEDDVNWGIRCTGEAFEEHFRTAEL